MQMTVRQIEAFLMVADMRSFTAAGTALHITQSAVSNLIKDLEGQVGVPLFDRTSRFVSLSPDGREFYGLAQKAFHEFLLMEKYAGDLCSLRAGRVRIVGAPLIACTLLPLLPEWLASPYEDRQDEIHAVFRGGRFLKPQTRAFIDFLVEAIRPLQGPR